ncbi:unnamed protein product [Ectocarpus sp. CCAP 1310/34]|nr:unnamed protein product [Ectocarpus sp. CCAP 1310/34]
MASVGMTFERVEEMAQELAVFRDQNRATATSNRAVPHEEVERTAVFLDAYSNMLQYQRIKVVNQYQADYDLLAYSMRRDHSKLVIDHVTPVKLEQPRISGDVRSYLADAADAKRILDAEVLAVVEAERAAGGELRQVKAPSFVEAPLKSEESTLRKASMPWAGNDLRLVTDMARVSVLCYSSEDLQKMCQHLRERFKALGFAVPRVANGFRSSFTPGGYRDVKMNVAVRLESGSEHLCEVQLHLEQFFVLKDASHKVYEWARGLRVTCNMSATHLFENVSPQVLKAMIEIAENNRAYANALPELMRYAGYPLKVAQIHREAVAEATRVYNRDAVNPTSDASRRAGIRLANASSSLAESLLDQVARTLITLALVLKTQAALGPNHPMVSSARNNMGCMLLDEVRGE